MPGWYVHMEAARQVARQLQGGTVPPGFPAGVADAQALGDICHRWRNYLAVGAIGPDLFFLLPDFANEKGAAVRDTTSWVIDVWDDLHRTFIGRFEEWLGPLGTNEQQLASQLTGGLSAQIGHGVELLAQALGEALKGLLANMGDWLGLLSSAVPQGVGHEAFFWSDMVHYRRTYQLPYVMFLEAQRARAAATTDRERFDAEGRIAFAIGWMSHCATDVTGHPFTNAKCGGPYRDHWQRHKLVENHFDTENYVAQHPGGPHYPEIGLSALHFWAAFRSGTAGPYLGRSDAPAYDYFAGLPPYALAPNPTGHAQRKAFFDLTSGPLPDHLMRAMLEAMATVYPDGPKILTQDPRFSATDKAGDPDGRPNADALGDMWRIAYTYLKIMASDGLAPARPVPPTVFTDHSFPTPPGGGDYGASDDPARGADIDDDSSFTLVDLLLAIVGWIIYLAQVAVWIATILPGLIIDIATFPARVVIYQYVLVPAWNLYMAARRALVMAGFLIPKPEEVDRGLTTLGTSNASGFDLGAALDDPAGVGTVPFPADEPSGRGDLNSAHGLDPEYPRNIVRDRPVDITTVDLAGILGLTGPLIYATDDLARLGLADPIGASTGGSGAGPGSWTPQGLLARSVVAAGFWYDPAQDVVFSTMYPWQRSFGYAYGYDASAHLAAVIVDCEPIFFDYDGRSWMIELWKGQYGLATGCEVGVYTRSSTASPMYTYLDATVGQRPYDPDPSRSRFFDCASDSDRLRISSVLHHQGVQVFTRGPEEHWWLTGFKPGSYSEPEDLTMDVSIECRDAPMTGALTDALTTMGYQNVQTTGNTVTFVFDTPRTHQPRDDVPQPLLAGVRAQNQVNVAAYKSLGLPTNDPNTVPDEALTALGQGFEVRSEAFLAQLVPHLAEQLRGFKPSAWVAPWRYPLTNRAGQPVPREGASVHAGPYRVGDRSTVLLPGPAGDNGARDILENCASPEDTYAALETLLPQDKHLGGPVDYGTYLVGRMMHAAAGDRETLPIPDFNLDSDRGYAWRCWDWDRHHAGAETASAADPRPRGAWVCVPDLDPTPQTDFSYRQPCTAPQLFDAKHDNPRQLVPGTNRPRAEQWYDPNRDLAVHYLGRVAEPEPDPTGVDPCGGGQPGPAPLGPIGRPQAVRPPDWREPLRPRLQWEPPRSPSGGVPPTPPHPDEG